MNERDTQTKIKHEILGEYMIKWGSIITNGIKNWIAKNPQYRARFTPPRFVYVDYFAYLGAYRENQETVYGSPVLGVRALDEIRSFFAKEVGSTPTTAAILFEQERNICDGLLGTLQEQGYAERIKRTDTFSTLNDRDIAVVNGDSSQYVDAVLDFIDRADPTYSFHFIDPFGSKGVRRINLEKIVSKRRADCIMTMMINHFTRWIGVATKTSLSPAEQAHARFFDDYYGSGVWRDIARQIDAGGIDNQEGERRLVYEFDAILNGADKELTVKQIPLKFQDRDQTLYYLFLTTHDPTGACAMNEILDDARIREYDYRTEKRRLRKQPGQLQLGWFDELPDRKRPEEPQPDIDLLIGDIYSVCQKRTMTFRDILREMCNTAFYQKDVREALGKLRQQRRASFSGAPSRLTNNSEVKFE